ncbi:MAG TPA: TetR/AcrR family transcriptional regulator [Panacibacter sp.]|nr:TetR/AcrR family transcriptional regulator [Panacibacter sp.]HNP45069.1 TetR/AcrR family transcriptional regulator [Panacibacter sp.]
MANAKDEMLSTCLKYFLQHGIRKMSNEKLVALLGISTKTIYKYFKNKEKLLEEVLHLYHDQRYEMLQNLPPGQDTVSLLFDVWRNAIETEPRVSKLFYQDLDYYYPKLAKKVESSISKKFSDKFIEMIEHGIVEGVFRKDIVPAIVLEGIYALYVSIVREKQYKLLSASTYEILQNTIAVYFRGFCTHKGITILDRHINQYNATQKSTNPKKY